MSRAGARAGAAALALLGLGLLPAWALSLQTPFRLIDDYGAVLVVRRLGVAGFLRDNFSLAVNPTRFRPTHDLGQLVAWGLFASHAAGHHLMRLLMKLCAFAALFAVAMHAVERTAGRRLELARRLPLLALAVASSSTSPTIPRRGWRRRSWRRSCTSWARSSSWARRPAFAPAWPTCAASPASRWRSGPKSRTSSSARRC